MNAVLEFASPPPRNRNVGIDAFRVFAFAAVILIHTANLEDRSLDSPGQYIVALCRFAVPYFFIVSGYFGARYSGPIMPQVWRIISRTLPVFLFWGLVYELLFYHSLSRLFSLDGFARFLFTGGAGYHLWFLPALGLSLALYLILRRFDWRIQVSIAAVLYVFGYAFGPVREVFGLPDLPINTRNGPFFGYPFILMGAWFANRKPVFRAPVAWLLLILGGAAQIMEGQMYFAFGLPVSVPDFGASTLLYGFGTLAVAHGLKPGRIVSSIARLGTLALGYYVMHAAAIYGFQQLFPPVDLTSRLIVAALTLPASVIAIRLLYQIKAVRPLIS